MAPLIHSSSVVHSNRCVIVALTIRKLTDFTKNTYRDKPSSFKKLLEKDSSVSIHERSVKILASECIRSAITFSPPHLNEIFEVLNF